MASLLKAHALWWLLWCRDVFLTHIHVNLPWEELITFLESSLFAAVQHFCIQPCAFSNPVVCFHTVLFFLLFLPFHPHLHASANRSLEHDGAVLIKTLVWTKAKSSDNMMFSIPLKLILLNVIAGVWLEFKTVTMTAIEDERINTSYWINR